MNNTSNENQHDNAELIFEYTQTCLNNVNKGLDAIERKLTTVIASSAILLKFAAELPRIGFGFQLSRSLICLLLVGAIILCLCGLLPKATGSIASPEELDKEWLYSDATQCRRFVAHAWMTTRQELKVLYVKRKEKLEHAYYFIASAAILFGGTIICSTFFDKSCPLPPVQ